MAYPPLHRLIFTAMKTFPASHRSELLFGMLIVGMLLLSLPTQADAEAFDRIQIGLSGSSDIANGPLGDYYSPDNGLHLTIQIPFYAGTFLAGKRWMRYRSGTDTRPDMQSGYTYLGWGYPIHLPAKITITAGAAFGPFSMKGDEDDLPDWETRWAETEYGTSFEAVVDWKFFRNVSLFAQVSQLTVFTEKRLHLSYFAAGAAYQITTPTIVREFLR